MIDYTSYNEMRAQDVVPNEDFKVIKIKDVLSPSIIEYLYSAIEDSNVTVQEWGGRKSWAMHSHPLFYRAVNEAVKRATGENVFLMEFFFLRYSNEYGYQSKLFPHYDKYDSQRLTLDIQLNYNKDWAVVVEGESFNLEYNEGLLFSGTQQIHWREQTDFKDGDVVDMIICNLKYDPDIKNSDDQEDILQKRSLFLMEQTGIGNTPIEIS
jgi:ACT domain-containing protein